MVNKPTLAVCLITYNQANYVKAAIDSILSQKVNFTWELVIADDYSTDGTRKILLEYKEKYPDLIKLILQKKNVGAERNWLDLISYPESKYIAYLEGDDYWSDPRKLQLQVDFLEKNPDYVMIFHPTKVFYENNEEKQTIWPNLTPNTELTTEALLKENFIPSNSVVYRRQNYKNIPLGVMPGDWYLHLYHAQFGKIGVIHKVMSAYRRHSEGTWWDSYKNQDKLWKSYAAPQVAMYIELLKLFGANPERKKIIYKAIIKILGTVIALDSKYGEHMLAKVLKLFPDYVDEFIAAHNNELQEHIGKLQNKDIQIDELHAEIVDLRAQVFRIRDELYALKNSRSIGKAIQLRDFLRVWITKVRSVYFFVKSKIRVALASTLPLFMRIPMRVSYRFMKKVFKKGLRYIYREKLAKTKIHVNKPWHQNVPLVSVVVPYYNRADTIDDTLKSLLAQTFTNFEIVIVDDGSTDPDSVQKLKDIKASGFKAQFIFQQNQGVAAARNNGIKKARGKYIVCLDSDDMLDPTYIEKCTIILESSPDLSLVTTQMDVFGVIKERSKQGPYDPEYLFSDNMVITASEFKKEAWRVSGGYKSGIGYEDWEFWMNLAANGYWGRLLGEPLFKYRTSVQSKYIEDKDMHWKNIEDIRRYHPNYKKKVRKLIAKHQYINNVIEPTSVFVNLDQHSSYAGVGKKPNILITIPWMTFGGAETLIYNFCREIKDSFNISFVTGLTSEHEWEYKFKEITPNVYHMANLFEDKGMHLEFISNYIRTRNIDVLSIIHNGFTFEMLPELRRRHPKLKVVVTLFNDRVEYFSQSIEHANYIDAFATDNTKVANNYQKQLSVGSDIIVIPNGINCYEEFSPALFDRAAERASLGIADKDLAVFFVGRLSEEKNPNVFINAASEILIKHKTKNIKFFVIGDGPMRGAVEEMIASHKTDAIIYLGYQSEVAKYLSAADIFVLPSSIEGFPLSIIEAMAMKVAVVASDVGAVAEIIDSGHEGIVVRPGSVYEIAQAISKLQKDPQLLASIKSAGRVKVEAKYSNVVLGKNYTNLYNDILK